MVKGNHSESSINLKPTLSAIFLEIFIKPISHFDRLKLSNLRTDGKTKPTFGNSITRFF